MTLQGEMVLQIWDVEHGACAMLHHLQNGIAGRLAMIDSGCNDDWKPSTFIKQYLRRDRLDYLFITNADQDHMSDLQGLWDEGIAVSTFFRNRSYTSEQIRAIKRQSGPLTRDAERYVDLCARYSADVTEPFNDFMGGITAKVFRNAYPEFTETNDLSLAIFIEFSGFKILFPGDLEAAGWRALLRQPEFRQSLLGTNVLIASHHGRTNGFCEDIFAYFTPQAVVVSDQAKVGITQETLPDYRRVVRDEGVLVRTTMKRRHVLTTRRDGWIRFIVDAKGNFTIDTENLG